MASCKVDTSSKNESCCGSATGNIRTEICGPKPCSNPCSFKNDGCCDLTKLNLKLTYFNMPARAELVRWMLNFRGAQFEDCRVKQAEWATIKEQYPTKQLPVLEYTDAKSGKKCTVVQAAAIIRTVAGLTNLAGKTPIDAIEADQAYECIRDIRDLSFQVAAEKDETRKEQLKNKLKNETAPCMLSYLEKKVAANHGKFITGTDYTYADIAVAVLFDTLRARFPEDLATYEKTFPTLAQLAKKIAETEEIKKYLSKRPAPEQC